MEDIFNISKLNKTSPAKGKFLISEPFMEDNFFKRSVVFLCDHNDDGSFGFVLNNILSINMKDVMEGFEECEFEVGFGGPVNSSNLYYIHTLGDVLEGSICIQNGLYTGGDFEKLQGLINSGLVGENQVRFFLGYSGWTAGQLDQEIQDSAWIVTSSTQENIINTKDKELWKNLLNEMGGKFKAIANFPEDPSLN